MLKGAVKKLNAVGVSKVIENLLPKDVRKVLGPKSPGEGKANVPVKDPVREPIKDPVREPIKLPVKEPAKEPGSKPIKELVKVPIKVPDKSS